VFSEDSATRDSEYFTEVVAENPLTYTPSVLYSRRMASFTSLSTGDTMRIRVHIVLSAYVKGLGGDVA